MHVYMSIEAVAFRLIGLHNISLNVDKVQIELRSHSCYKLVAPPPLRVINNLLVLYHYRPKLGPLMPMACMFLILIYTTKQFV